MRTLNYIGCNYKKLHGCVGNFPQIEVKDYLSKGFEHIDGAVEAKFAVMPEWPYNENAIKFCNDEETKIRLSLIS